MSFRSQLSPTHISVFVWAPSPVRVLLQLHTKHVRPDFVASTHWPLPEQESVVSSHASCVVKQVEIELMGCWGSGRLEGRGDCSWRGMRLRFCWSCASKVRIASRNPSDLFKALLRNDRTIRTASRYSSLIEPYSERIFDRPRSSMAAKRDVPDSRNKFRLFSSDNRHNGPLPS